MYASDGYYSSTETKQVQYMDEVKKIVKDFYVRKLAEKKDQFDIQLFECHYKGKVDIGIDVILESKTN